MAFELPDLPYDYNALAPHIGAETMELHHSRHHKTYVDKLNGLIDGTPLADKTLDEIVQATFDDADKAGVFNNAGQAWNHNLFWQCLTPSGGGRPDESLGRQIDADFGSYDEFRKAFKEAATGQFGSGWAWLVLDNGKLKVTATPNAVTPIVHGQHPLLALDVWEHAYYLDYRNKRPDYIDAFLDGVVNWSFAAERFAV